MQAKLVMALVKTSSAGIHQSPVIFAPMSFQVGYKNEELKNTGFKGKCLRNPAFYLKFYVDRKIDSQDCPSGKP